MSNVPLAVSSSASEPPRGSRGPFTAAYEGWKTETLAHRSACVAILGFAIAFRLFHLNQPMRPDESWTFLDFALQPLSVALSDYSRPNNHIFHTLLVWVSTRLLGHAPWVIRLPAFIAGVLMVPATYVATRAIVGARPALIAAALTGALPGLVLYSTNARGYSAVCLWFLILIPIANALADADSTALWVAFAVVVALGEYTVPVMLYPAGTAGLWILLERASRKGAPGAVRLIPRAAAAAGLAIALTLLGYSPVIARSGIASVTSNVYVAAHTWPQIKQDIPWVLSTIRALHGLALSKFLIEILAFAGVLSFFSPRPERRKLVTLAVSLTLWSVLVVVVTRRPPPARAWLFLAPLACIYIGTGLAIAADRLSRPMRTSAEVLSIGTAAALTLLIGTKSLVDRTVFDGVNSGTLVDGQAIARALLAEMKDNDRIVTVHIHGVTAVVDYYLYTIGGRRLAVFDTLSRTGRVFVVVNPLHHETLKSVMADRTDIKWTEMDGPVLLRKFSTAAVYEARPRLVGLPHDTSWAPVPARRAARGSHGVDEVTRPQFRIPNSPRAPVGGRRIYDANTLDEIWPRQKKATFYWQGGDPEMMGDVPGNNGNGNGGGKGKP